MDTLRLGVPPKLLQTIAEVVAEVSGTNLAGVRRHSLLEARYGPIEGARCSWMIPIWLYASGA
jgi:hypothetical protein